MFDFARRQAIAIAADRVKHLTVDQKQLVLDYAGTVMEAWKYRQADENGTVEVAEFAGAGLLDGLALGKVPGARVKRVPVADLQPHECAGGVIACPADLLIMLWSDGYADAMKLDDGPGIDVATAALLERDGMSMPVDSIASAVRLLWTFAWTAAKVYRDGLRGAYADAKETVRSELKAQHNAHLAEARERSKATRTTAAARQDANIRRYVVDEVRRRPGVTSEVLARELWNRRDAVKLTPKLTPGGLKAKVARERLKALRDMSK